MRDWKEQRVRSALARSAIAMMKCFPVVSCHGSCHTSTTGSGGYDGLLQEVSSGANWSVAPVSKNPPYPPTMHIQTYLNTRFRLSDTAYGAAGTVCKEAFSTWHPLG